MIKWTFISLALLFTACGTGKNALQAKTDPEIKQAEKVYTYSDGSGNRYVFSRNSFEYFPVKQVESSTGHYDGGEPVKNKPGPELFVKVTTLIDRAFEAKADHSPDREKGTGKVEIKNASQYTVFILKMNSSWRSEIEAALTQMKIAK